LEVIIIIFFLNAHACFFRDLMLQWWCSKLLSTLPCIFSLFCLFDYWCVCLGVRLMLFCLGVSLLVYLCVHLMLLLVLYGCFVCLFIYMHPSSFGCLVSLCRESAKTKLLGFFSCEWWLVWSGCCKCTNHSRCIIYCNKKVVL